MRWLPVEHHYYSPYECPIIRTNQLLHCFAQSEIKMSSSDEQGDRNCLEMNQSRGQFAQCLSMPCANLNLSGLSVCVIGERRMSHAGMARSRMCSLSSAQPKLGAAGISGIFKSIVDDKETRSQDRGTSMHDPHQK